MRKFVNMKLDDVERAVSAGARSDAAVKSAARAIDIIELVASAPAARNAQQVSEALDIPPSSLSYLLATLVARGWLAIGPRRTYVIGGGLTALLAPERRALAERAAPLVRDISRQLDETCGYYEARGDELVALVSELGRQALNYAMRPGDRGPLHAYAAGKALLAARDDAALEEYLRSGELRRYTPATITDPAGLRHDILRTRERGYAVSMGEHTSGLVSIAVPVADGAGAISVAIPSIRFDEAVRARTLDLLRIAETRLRERSGELAQRDGSTAR